MKNVWTFWGIGFFLLCFCSEKRGAKSTVATTSLSRDSIVPFLYPSHFPPPLYDFTKEPLTKKKLELGRMFFYDPILSSDSTVACASCHQPFTAFAHREHPFSHGMKRQLGDRNAPGLFNLAWSPSFMMDGGVPNIEVLALVPITNRIEMGETLPHVLKKLNRNKVYRSKFKETFGTDSVYTEALLKSISQFVLSIVSYGSKYDQFVQQKDTLDQTERVGLAIFQQKCTPCHGGPLFTDFKFRNIGLDTSLFDSRDLGREKYTKERSDRRKFKTPTLRNFSVTSPYMHDGRALSLHQALDMHDGLIQKNRNLDSLLIRDGLVGIKLNEEERLALYFFLLTLTDKDLFKAKAYDSPFNTFPSMH